jgi:hypothetical protein
LSSHLQKPKPRAKGTSSRADEALNLSLPPLTNIDSIFEDLTRGFASELSDVFTKLNRPLRIATMCSGTEAPVLALRLLFRQLEAQTGVKAKLHHVFSAEIEPFKQAYIERNFSPPILFRDVVELKDKQARTAYGAMVDVPGEADILCVFLLSLSSSYECLLTFSDHRTASLVLPASTTRTSTARKRVSTTVESLVRPLPLPFLFPHSLSPPFSPRLLTGRTFHGMLQWVNNHRPPIVILENVSNAPWDSGVKHFADIDYSATYVRLDTKKYYIPHTRSRGCASLFFFSLCSSISTFPPLPYNVPSGSKHFRLTFVL